MKNTQILISKSIRRTRDNHFTPLSEVLNDIKSSPLNQALISLTSKGEFNKTDLPVIYFSISGLSQAPRNDRNVSAHSGLIVIDIDNLDRHSILDVRSRLIKDKYVLSVFRSPSGYLKVLFRVKPEVTTHKNTYYSIKNYLERQYPELITPTDSGVKIIDTSGSNISRACFISYDPNIYINYKCELFDQLTKNEKVDKSIDKARGIVISEDVPFLDDRIDARIDNGTGLLFNYQTRLNESFFDEINSPLIIPEGIPSGQTFGNWQNPIPEGKRHSSIGAVSLVMIYNNRARELKNILGLAITFNDKYCRPPLPHKEVENLFKKNYQRFREGRISVDELVKRGILSMKYTFWSRNCTLTPKEKSTLGREVKFEKVIEKRSELIQKIINKSLNFEKKLFQKNISAELGVSSKTLSRTLKRIELDLNSVKSRYNRDYDIWEKEFRKVLSEIEPEDLDEDLLDHLRWTLVPQEYHDFHIDFTEIDNS